MVRRKPIWKRLTSGLYVPPLLGLGNPWPCSGCCGSTDVLLWWTNCECGVGSAAPNQAAAKTFYETLGLSVDTNSDWTENIDDYQLILWPASTSDPPRWSAIDDGAAGDPSGWSGRIVMSAEHNLFAAQRASITYVNTKVGTTGITIVGDNIDAGCLGWEGSIEVDDLTAGATVMEYAGTSQTSGGTVLSKTATGALPWLARNKPSGSTIDFVVSGDSNYMFGCSGAHDANFFENLWTVSI